MDEAEKNRMLFTQLVIMFHAATMQQLGKVKHPVTGEITKDLPAAQASIDILDMLRAVTKGNLSTEEDQLLAGILQELKLVFVQESKS
jgi:transcriptional regulator of NAD metabolism